MSQSPYVIDMRAKPPAAPAPASARPAAPPPPAATPPPPSAPSAHAARRRARWSWRAAIKHLIKANLIIAAAIGCLLLTIPLPERLIGIYFAASLIYAIDSQRTFLVALIFLAIVAVWSATGQTVSAETYAVYAFYFLVIGLVSAIREAFKKRSTN